MRVESRFHLFWVTVPEDPSEDWFVFAPGPSSAQSFLESYEGFDRRKAEARLIESDVHLEKLERRESPCWAQLADLEAIGFEILSGPPNPRVVRRDGETFVEGYLESDILQIRDDLAKASGRGRTNGTRRIGRPN
jgi:hypothetical protein